MHLLKGKLHKIRVHLQTAEPWAHQPVVTYMRAGEAVLFLWTGRSVKKHLGKEPALSLLLQAHLGCICSVNRGLWEQKDSQICLAFFQVHSFFSLNSWVLFWEVVKKNKWKQYFFTDGRKSELDRSYPFCMLLPFSYQSSHSSVLSKSFAYTAFVLQVKPHC